MTQQAVPTGLDLARVALRDGRNPLTLGKAIAAALRRHPGCDCVRTGRPRAGGDIQRASSGRASPAGAGTTPGASRFRTVQSSYPRRRGDDAPGIAETVRRFEQPPRVRRTTHVAPSFRRRGTSYPRGRGDDVPIPGTHAAFAELPPRTRGRRGVAEELGGFPRATPAQAGVSRPRVRSTTLRRCPPRAGGGEPWSPSAPCRWRWSSPRRRG